MRSRVGCGHAGTGAVAVPSMSYETALQRHGCLYESYEYQKHYNIPAIRTRFRTTLSSEYHITHRAPSLTRRFLAGSRHISPTEV